MPSRTTEWRWKTRGQPKLLKSGLKRGRRLRNDNIRHKTLVRTAALIDESIICGSGDYVDYVKVEAELRQRFSERCVPSVFDAINKWDFPAELIAVATVDDLKIGTRTRTRKQKIIWTEWGLTNALLEKCPYLSAVQAAKYARAYVAGDEDTQNWIDLVLESERSLRSAVDRRCCVSKIFRHIKKRMSCYWRKHPDYEGCRGLLRNLVVCYVTQQPSQTAQRSSFASA